MLLMTRLITQNRALQLAKNIIKIKLFAVLDNFSNFYSLIWSEKLIRYKFTFSRISLLKELRILKCDKEEEL